MYLKVPGQGSPKMVESTGTWHSEPPWHLALITLSVRGLMQFTDHSVFPCALQIAIENRP